MFLQVVRYIMVGVWWSGANGVLNSELTLKVPLDEFAVNTTAPSLALLVGEYKALASSNVLTLQNSDNGSLAGREQNYGSRARSCSNNRGLSVVLGSSSHVGQPLALLLGVLLVF
jgi:hypothetical protein